MTEREREYEHGEKIDDLKTEYPGAPAASGPTREDPAVQGNMRVEPTNERPTGGSAKSFDAPERSGQGQSVVWITALVILAVVLVVVLVWALSVLIPFGV